MLAGCLTGNTYNVDVTWVTEGHSTSIPDEEMGARIFYYGTNHGLGTSIWVPGYSSAARVDVQTGTDTTEICVQLERKTIELVERFGHTVEEEVYTDLSERVCQDVLVDDEDNPRADFTLVFAE